MKIGKLSGFAKILFLFLLRATLIQIDVCVVVLDIEGEIIVGFIQILSDFEFFLI